MMLLIRFLSSEYSVEQAYRAIDGVKRLFDGLEIAGEDACESPGEVGRESQMAAEGPVDAYRQAELR